MIILLMLVIISGYLYGCKSAYRQKPLKAVFQSGEMHFISTRKPVSGGYELTLMARCFLNKTDVSPELNNYFQYQLGKKIKLVIGKDTLSPAISYAVPLLRETNKEIDCKYLLTEENMAKPTHIIVDDNVLDLDKINLLLK